MFRMMLKTLGVRRGGRPDALPGMACIARTVAAIIIGFVLSATAAPNVDVTAKVDRSEITIGDRVQYEIDVTGPASGHVELPAVLGNLGAFEVKDYHTQTTTSKDGRSTVSYLFTISTFTVGTYTLPPQRVEFYSGGQSSMPTDTLVLYTQPTEIKVKRTSPETEKDIADIADVAVLPEPPPWGAIGLGFIVLALIGFFVWRGIQAKKSLAAAEPPPLPPYEEALHRLHLLREANLPSQNLSREFAFTLSEILRNYVGRRYGIEALESTTEEFLGKATPLPLSQIQQDWLREFCESLDPLKYATVGITNDEAEKRIREMEDFAERTKPSSPPSPPEGGKSGGPQK